MSYVLKAEPPPLAPNYGLEALNLSPRFTRAIYKERFGQQAPPWDKSRPIKRWADFSVTDKAAQTPHAPYTYSAYVNQNNGTARYTTFTTTMAHAATFNLPGVYDYPKYVAPPAKAWYQVVDAQGATVGTSPVPAEEIASQEMCDALVAEIESFGIKVLRVRLDGGSRVVWDPAETRRFATLYLSDSEFFSVARLLSIRNRKGVGSPGKWVVFTSTPFAGRQTNVLTWESQVPDDTSEFDPRPEVVIPQRALSVDEEIRPWIGGVLQVVKKNTASEGSTGGGGLTLAQSIVLERVDLNVQRLLNLQGAEGQ